MNMILTRFIVRWLFSVYQFGVSGCLVSGVQMSLVFHHAFMSIMNYTLSQQGLGRLGPDLRAITRLFLYFLQLGF